MKTSKILESIKGLTVDEIEDVKIKYLRKSKECFFKAFILDIILFMGIGILSSYGNEKMSNVLTYLLVILLILPFFISYKGYQYAKYFRYINGKYTFKSILIFIINFFFGFPVFILYIFKKAFLSALSSLQIIKLYHIIKNLIDIKRNKKNKEKQLIKSKVLESIQMLNKEDQKKVKTKYLRKSINLFFISFSLLLIPILFYFAPSSDENEMNIYNFYIIIGFEIIYIILIIFIAFLGAKNAIYFKYINGKHIFKSRLFFFLNFLFSFPILIFYYKKEFKIILDLIGIVKSEI